MNATIENMASEMASKEWQLKKISNFWFLDVGGTLKRLNILDNAKDVHIDENVIFADGTIYQLSTESNGEIVVCEIESVRNKVKTTAQNEVDNSGTTDNNISDGETKDCDYSSCASLKVEETKGNGAFRGFFERIKKVVKRKPDRKQKEEPLYDEIPNVGNVDLILNSDNEDTSENDKVSVELLKKNFINTDEVSGSKLVTALYDFNAFQDDEISFSKADRLKLYGEDDGQKTEWCSAEHLKTRKRGYIPRTYVTNNKYTLRSNDWWFDIDRYSADVLLKTSNLPIGTFVVRKSDGNDMFTLSILTERETQPGCRRIAHYRIRSHSERLYIAVRRMFTDLSELVDFYKSTADGLVCKLSNPPPKKNPILYPRSLVIDRKCLDVMEPLKYGTYGNLFSGNFRNTLDVTIVELAEGPLTADDFLNEAKTLYYFRNSQANIIRVIAACVKPEPFMVVIGETIWSTLKEYLREDGGKTVDFEYLIRISAEITDGMAFLETSTVVHRHLKADCVFVCDLNVVKIAHPKLTSMMKGSVEKKDMKETDEWKWTAPEAVRNEKKFSTKSDVWSYGVLLYELITLGEEPYKGFTAEDTLTRLEKGFRLQKPCNGPIECPVAFYITILKCWHRLPECRPTFDFLKDFFQNFDNAVEYVIGLGDANIQDLYMCGSLEQMEDSKQLNNENGEQVDMQPSQQDAPETDGSSAQTPSRSAKLTMNRGFSVKALYDYTAEANDEISIFRDDIITDVDATNEGWWEGTALNGSRGIFPSNFVELHDGEEIYLELSQQDSPETTKTDGSSAHTTNSSPKLTISGGFSVKSLYDFTSEVDGEISILKNDILTNVDLINEHWWKGTASDGTRGIFPSNYVEIYENSYA